ncbi:hypothetical protein [Aquamicrobium sp. LC103]|uniref:hypothetical protein n=1 Tax=Aquamicrobium sp. LC103 TaxID=1120658 RepID=UPI0010C992C1|nr:hypothetical protein [Aquamicrobium sp. LC103]TKT78436.1 hypothetical protein XW59_012535 [Aquamicrobium sp. LC103]
MDVNGLKVSKPGFNVLNASNLNLQFISIASQLPKLMGGSVHRGSAGPSDVYYGKTFTGIPLVFWTPSFGDHFNRDGWLLCGTTEYFYAQAFVYPDRIRFIHRTSNITFRYIVWDFST